MKEKLENNKVISQGWTKAKIKDIVYLINGKAFKPSDWKKKGLPIIRIQNLNNINAEFNYCDDAEIERFIIKKGELLFAWSGTPGTSFGTHIWKGEKAWLNQHIYKVVLNEKYINKKFLRFAINQNLEIYINQAHGAGWTGTYNKRNV